MEAAEQANAIKLVHTSCEKASKPYYSCRPIVPQQVAMAVLWLGFRIGFGLAVERPWSLSKACAGDLTRCPCETRRAAAGPPVVADLLVRRVSWSCRWPSDSEAAHALHAAALCTSRRRGNCNLKLVIMSRPTVKIDIFPRRRK